MPFAVFIGYGPVRLRFFFRFRNRTSKHYWARRPSPTLILAYLHPLLSSGVHIAGKRTQQRWFPTSVEHRKGVLSLFRHVKVAITTLTRQNRLTYTQWREFSLR